MTGDGARPNLRLTLLGPMRACDRDGNDVLPRLRKAQAILAILALAGPRAIRRSRLIELLWSRSDPPRALISLRMAIYTLKAALGPAAGLLHAGRTDIALDNAGLDVDALRFGSGCPGIQIPWLTTLLPGLAGIDPVFDRWLNEQQTDLTRRVRIAAEMVPVPAPAEAEAAGEGLPAVDGVHRAAWRALPRAQVARDDLAVAIGVFERSRSALSWHLPVDPPSETIAPLGVPCTTPVSGRAVPRDRSDECRADDGRPPHRRAWIGVARPRCDDDAVSVEQAATLTDELIGALGRFRSLGGIPAETARNESDADFLLTGAIRRYGDRLRVSLRLVDQRAGGTVAWAERYDLSDDGAEPPFAAIAGTTAARIDGRLWFWPADESGAVDAMALPPEELVRRASPMVHRPDRDGFMTAGRWLRRAVAIAPDNAAAHASLVQWCLHCAGQGWAADPGAMLMQAKYLAERSVRLDPEDARGLTLAGHVLAFLDHRPDEGLRMHERAIAANPNLPLAWCLSGLARSYIGDCTEAIRGICLARALAPGDPFDYFVEHAFSIANLLAGDFEVAAAAGQRAIMLNPRFSSSLKCHLAAIGHLGRKDDATSSLAGLQMVEPGFSVEQAIHRSPIANPGGRTLFAEGLLAAGVRRA